MASVQGNYDGSIKRVYMIDTVTAHTKSAIESALVASNRINNITTIGDLQEDAPIIEFPIAGEPQARSIPAQKSAGTYEISIAVDWSDTSCVRINNDDGRSTRTFVQVIYQSDTKQTYMIFDGRVGSKTLSGDIGSVETMQISIAMSGSRTIIHK